MGFTGMGGQNGLQHLHDRRKVPPHQWLIHGRLGGKCRFRR
jgi:hypothetical protein